MSMRSPVDAGAGSYENSPSSAPKKNWTGNEDAAGVKVSGLRIETNTPAMWRASLRERTNTALLKPRLAPPAAVLPTLLPALKPVSKQYSNARPNDTFEVPSATLPKWRIPSNSSSKFVVAEPKPLMKSANSGILMPSTGPSTPYSRSSYSRAATPSRNTPTPTNQRPSHRRTPSTSTYAPAFPPESLPTDPASRRQRRYALAEAALARSLAPHSETPPAPLELQIRALEQATALLALSAEEARSRVAQLKEVNRENEEPKVWESLQKERWLVEKRKSIVEGEVEAVNEYLLSLKRFGGKSRKVATVAPGSRRVAKEKVVIKQDLPERLTEEQARKQANLMRFFEVSPTRAPMSHPSRRKRTTFNPSTCERRVTISSSSPMRLRSSVVPTFSPYGSALPAQKSRHPQSDVSSTPSPAPEVSAATKPTAKIAQYPTLPTLEEIEGSLPMTPPLPLQTQEPSTLTSNHAPQRHDEPKPAAPISPGAGFARIYAPKPSVPRSKADILAGARQLDNGPVEIPSYVLELMGDFGRDLGEDVSLQDTPHVALVSPKEGSAKAKSKNARPLSLGALPSRSRSLLRKPSLTATRKPRVSMGAHHSRPLAGLFSIAEASTASFDRNERSAPVLSLSLTAERLNMGMGIETEAQDVPEVQTFPSQDSLPRRSSSSSFEMVGYPSTDALVKTPSKLRRHLSFLGRK
ncbi:hypothetical protein HWV62_4579 [Athelia sp. TMB]|nr:hypothetical protein HWV62_4579 [Athelia sp. TMB]